MANFNSAASSVFNKGQGATSLSAVRLPWDEIHSRAAEEMLILPRTHHISDDLVSLGCNILGLVSFGLLFYFIFFRLIRNLVFVNSTHFNKFWSYFLYKLFEA